LPQTEIDLGDLGWSGSSNDLVQDAHQGLSVSNDHAHSHSCATRNQGHPHGQDDKQAHGETHSHNHSHAHHHDHDNHPHTASTCLAFRRRLGSCLPDPPSDPCGPDAWWFECLYDAALTMCGTAPAESEHSHDHGHHHGPHSEQYMYILCPPGARVSLKSPKGPRGE
jgi:hypothetical protein